MEKFKIKVQECGKPIIDEFNHVNNPVIHWGDGVFEIIVWTNQEYNLYDLNLFTGSYYQGGDKGSALHIMGQGIHTEISIPDLNFEWDHTEITFWRKCNQVRIYLQNEEPFSKIHKSETGSGVEEIEVEIIE